METNVPKVEDLRDVLSMEDQEADLMHLDVSAGQLKVRPSRAVIGLPQGPEELRLRHRRIAITWEMTRTKHRNRGWLGGDIRDAFRKLSDHILGKHVHGISLPNDARPGWQFVLEYEHAVRKKAYNWVRLAEVDSIVEGILKAMKDPEVMNLHFVVPVTTWSGAASSRAPSGATLLHKPAPKKRPEGREDGSPPKKSKKGLHVKTPEGKAICFKYNNNKCTNAKCTFLHVCQKCLGQHPKSSCVKLKNDTKGAGTE